MIPRTTGTYFGQSMTANCIYTIAGGGSPDFGTDGRVATSTQLNNPRGVYVDAGGNIIITDYSNNRVLFVPKTTGTYFGQSMTVNCIYTITGNGDWHYGGDGGIATAAGVYNPADVALDSGGNLYIAEQGNSRIRFVPRSNGTYFGQSMTANYIYTIAGNGTATFGGDGGAPTAASLNLPSGVGFDASGNLYIADTYNCRIRFIPKSDGTYFGQAMTTNNIYTIGGNGTGNNGGDGGAATSVGLNYPVRTVVDQDGNVLLSVTYGWRVRIIAKNSGTYYGQSMTANNIYEFVYANKEPYGLGIDAGGNVYIAGSGTNYLKFVPKKSGTYFGQSMTANNLYNIAGTGNSNYTGENSAATSKKLYAPVGVFAAPDHMVYVTDYNNKIRMIAAEDFIAPSTSTLAATAGVGQVTLTWNSAGDDNVNLGNLTGNYRIQYATYPASWSTGSTPTNATTVTISTTNATPGAAQSYVAGSLTPGNTYYFALFTADEVPNWSDVSNTASAWLDGTPPSTSTLVAVPGSNMGEINLSWNSAGDDGMSGSLTGNYRIQYATYTVTWSTSSTPTNATTVTIATTTQTPGSAQATTISSLTGGTTYYFVLWSQDESNNWSAISNAASTYATGDVTAPSTSTLTAVPGATEGKINLSWNSAGDDGVTGNLTGIYRIQYATYTVAWSTSSTPTDATTVTIATTTQTSGSAQATTISSLTGGTTYYFVLWSQDESSNWSGISNIASTFAAGDGIAPSSSTLTATTSLATDGGIDLSWTSAGDDGMTGNLSGHYRIQYATTPTISWSTSTTPSGATTLTISTVGVTPGSSQSVEVVVGLVQTWYFVIWTQDESNNWSVISATASAVPFVAIRSVSITYGNMQAFGLGTMGTSAVGSTGTVVNNDGTLLNTYSLRASTSTPGSPWQIAASTPAGPDTLVIYGVFHGATAPDMGDFGPEDVIGPMDRNSTNTQFTVLGSTTGVAVPAGENRNLWIRMDYPTLTTTMAEQSMRVEITAQPP